MMTGQILGGAPVDDAVRYQQIIMFMITASVTLATCTTVLIAVMVCIDNDDRLRLDKITMNK